MKSLFVLLFAVVLINGISAQSTRLVLIEEATNASCGPCASQNPAFDALLNQNRDKLTAVKYHASWPGYDPMYNHNTTENSARISYYGINGVPTAVLDGEIPNGPTFGYPGAPSGFNQAIIDAAAAIPSPFEILLSHRLSPGEDTIYVDMLVKATEEMTGPLRAHIAVIEKEIHFTSAPGSNGEKDFIDVMKKMLPGSGGTALPTSFDAGDYVILQYHWALANVYNIDELGVVGFVQDNTVKDVHQAGNSSTDPITPPYDVDLQVLEITNVPETNCLGTISPVVRIRNNGSSDVSSFIVKYNVNSDTVSEYSWAGALSFMDVATIALPAIDFTVQDNNTITIETVTPNGVEDDYQKNDSLALDFARAEVTPETVTLMLRTDDNPDEITWEIYNSSDEVVLTGGPYSQANTMITEELQLPYYDCFKFLIYDDGGDGLQMPGFYALFHSGNVTIASGTTFGSRDSAYFEGYTGVGIPQQAIPVGLNIYPNPARDRMSIEFTQATTGNVIIEIYNLLGIKISEIYNGYLETGSQRIEANVADIPRGLYMVNIKSSNSNISQKISIIN